VICGQLKHAAVTWYDEVDSEPRHHIVATGGLRSRQQADGYPVRRVLDVRLTLEQITFKRNMPVIINNKY